MGLNAHGWSNTPSVCILVFVWSTCFCWILLVFPKRKQFPSVATLSLLSSLHPCPCPHYPHVEHTCKWSTTSLPSRESQWRDRTSIDSRGGGIKRVILEYLTNRQSKNHTRELDCSCTRDDNGPKRFDATEFITSQVGMDSELTWVIYIIWPFVLC